MLGQVDSVLSVIYLPISIPYGGAFDESTASEDHHYHKTVEVYSLAQRTHSSLAITEKYTQTVNRIRAIGSN